MPNHFEVIRADRAVIEKTAADLRHRAIFAGYAGLSGQHFAFALALILDELARHARGVPDEARGTVVRACRLILDNNGQP
jgi:hypothetical protein